VLAWASPHLPPVTLAASLVQYEYDSGEKRFQEQLQPIYSKQELKKFYYCISFGQTYENKLELELNLKKTNFCDAVKFLFVSFFYTFALKLFEFCQIKLG